MLYQLINQDKEPTGLVKIISFGESNKSEEDAINTLDNAWYIRTQYLVDDPDDIDAFIEFCEWAYELILERVFVTEIHA